MSSISISIDKFCSIYNQYVLVNLPWYIGICSEPGFYVSHDRKTSLGIVARELMGVDNANLNGFY